MKKMLALIVLLSLCIGISAKKPKVVVENDAVYSCIKVLNDSTVEYHQVYAVQVAQSKDVWSAIMTIPSASEVKKGKRPELMCMQCGAFIWHTPDGESGNYILYSGKAFDRVVLRATDSMR